MGELAPISRLREGFIRDCSILGDGHTWDYFCLTATTMTTKAARAAPSDSRDITCVIGDIIDLRAVITRFSMTRHADAAARELIFARPNSMRRHYFEE